MKVFCILLLALSGMSFSANSQDFLFQEINSGSSYYSEDITMISTTGDLFYGEIAGQDYKIVSPLAIFIHNQPTGLEDHTIINDLKIYPNPCSDILYMSFGLEREITFRMFNTKGILVEHFEVKGEYEMETKSLPQGIYLITISDNSTGAIHSEKIIKTN